MRQDIPEGYDRRRGGRKKMPPKVFGKSDLEPLPVLLGWSRSGLIRASLRRGSDRWERAEKSRTSPTISVVGAIDLPSYFREDIQSSLSELP